MKSQGFTLIELIVSLLIIAVLGFTVAPRLFQAQTFQERAFADQVISIARYGQKIAVAKRANIFLNVAPDNSICLSYTSDAACNGDQWVGEPANQQLRYLEPAPSGVTLTPAAVISFSPLGRPSQGLVVNINGSDMARSVTIEPETGLVH